MVVLGDVAHFYVRSDGPRAMRQGSISARYLMWASLLDLLSYY